MSDLSGIGVHRGVVIAVGDEQRQDFCAGKGKVRSNRLLPEDKSLRPRAYAVTGGVRCAECVHEVVWFKRKNRKEPFEWVQVLDFAKAYGVRHQKEAHYNEGMLRASGPQWVCNPILEGWESSWGELITREEQPTKVRA